MATIKDIAAKLNEGCSYSEVSKALGISKSTVSKYANRIKQSNLTLAQASECQEQELEETVRVPIKREYRDFNAEEILGKLTNVKYATRQLLYEHYKSEAPRNCLLLCDILSPAGKADQRKNTDSDLYQFRTNPRRVARSRLCRRLSYLD